MFENETKGSFGSYSYAGRSSAQIYHVIVNKDKIFEKHGNNKRKDFFLLNEEDKSMKYGYLDKIDIFNPDLVPNKSQGNLKKNKKKNQNIPKESKISRINEIRGNAHKNPSINFMYNPKMDYILKRTLTGPKWSTMKGRDDTSSSDKNHNSGYYIPKDTHSSNGKTFVNMSKQTQRGAFSCSKDVRLRTETPFRPQKKSKTNRKSKTSITELTNRVNNDTLNDNTIQSTNRNSFAYRPSGTANLNQINIKRDNKYVKTVSDSVVHTAGNEKGSNYIIKGPDFSRTISREKLNFINRDRSTISPYIIPNYSAVRDRPLSMVSYERSVHSHKKRNGLRDLTSEPYLTHDPNKLINNINNHISSPVPNFGIMTSRPNRHEILPSYMQNTFDRNSLYNTTAKTLMLNNYQNSRSNTNYNTFGQKKSFNTIINFNLLSSNNSLNNIKTEKLTKDELAFNKKMIYYRNNLDKLAFNQYTSTFDGVTLKSIPRKHIIDENEKKKFLIDFGNGN